MKSIAYLTLSLFFALSLLAGCATQTTTKTVKTETIIQHAKETTEDTAEPVAVERQTTETTTTEGQSVGLLSGAVHVAGQVLALPFRAVGGLISSIF